MRSFPLFFLVCLLLVGCGPKNNDDSKSEGGYDIVVIPKGTSHEFWKSIHAGAIKAQREFTNIPVHVKWNGPLREDDRDGQIKVVENATVRKASALVLAPLDSQALVAPVEAAVDAGIPVVIIDSALNSRRPISYVATDNFKGGQMAGEHLGALLNGQGKVIVLRYQVGSASTEQREAGFLDEMSNSFPNIQIISSDQYSGATRDSAFQIAQTLLQKYGGEVTGIFAPCEPVTIGMMLALQAINRGGGSVKLIGFDATEAAVAGLRNEDIQALVVQNPVQMGYLGVKAAVEHLQGRAVTKVVDTGVHLVTKENMESPEMSALLHPPLDQYLK